MEKPVTVMIAEGWSRVSHRFLPFADAATPDLPLTRLVRLSLFQVSIGMAVVLLTGTLNRVMILELGVAAWLVSAMVSLPLIFAPFRALIGHKSDQHRSILGWRRVPYIWIGTMIMFGGLAIMPFALLVLSGTGVGDVAWGQAGAALAFLMIGAGLHTTQTAGLALATDLATEETRPRVIALMYVMLLVGMVVAALAFGWLLADYSHQTLIQVIQGAAVVTIVLNGIALWKQEARNPEATRPDRPRVAFDESWKEFSKGGRATRLLVAVGLGTAGFSMQDILLEPYGGEILNLTVGQTTALTALLAGGTLVGFALAARLLTRGTDAHRLAAMGALAGIFAFSLVIFADPFQSTLLFRVGVTLIGFGGGLFAVGTLSAAMALAKNGLSGIALGAWGAVQATAAGLAIFAGGALRDWVAALAADGALGPALTDPAVGYGFVYHLEILFLFATLAAIGPLVRFRDGGAGRGAAKDGTKFGLAEFPG